MNGRDSKGRFTEGSKAAVEAGKKGGTTAQKNRTAYRLSKIEMAKGGRNSHKPRE